MSKPATRRPMQQVGSFLDMLLPVAAVADTAPVARRRKLTQREQLEQAFEDAKLRGYREGLAAGQEDGRAIGAQMGQREAAEELTRASSIEIERFCRELQSVLDRVDDALERWKRDAESRLTDLAIVAVRKVLSSELNISRESALGIVREAVAEVTHSSKARIRLNPFDLETISAYREQILAASASLRGVEFVADESIEAGCIIETDGGLVDASSGTRLLLIVNEMEDAA